MIFLDLIDLQKLRRTILYLFCIAVTLWLQLSVFSRLALPGNVKPFFVPVIVTAIGMWEGGVWGAVLGGFTGLYCDMNMLDSSVLLLVLFTAFGFFSGVLADYLINRRFVAYLMLTAMALLLAALCQGFPLWAFHGTSLGLLLPVVLVQTLWSVPFAVPAYFAVKAISGQTREG